MDKLRFGHCEKAVTIWLIGVVPVFLLFMMGMPFIYSIVIIINIFISFIGVLWLVVHVRKNRLMPLLDEAKPNETVWLRFTKDKIFVPQFVKKGTFGVTNGIIYGEKADVLDEGDFPVKTLNGNPAVIMYDLMNTTGDLRRNIGRRFMMKRYNIKGGIDGYNKAKTQKRVGK